MQRINADLPFILVSGTIGEEMAVNAMRLGASDYILKDNLKRLLPAAEREIRDYEIRKKEIQGRKQLRLTELRYKFLAESIQEVLFSLDFNFRITYWNETASKVFKKTNVVGKYLHEVFPSWKGGDVFSVLSEALKTGLAKPLAFKYKFKTVTYFKGRVYPSSEGISILLRNVTEEYLNRQKLERLNDELETLFYRISHDLKGPVASALGLLNIANRDISMTKEQLTVMMKSNIDRLNAVLVELLDITNIKTGNSKVSTFEVVPCIQQIIETLKHQAGTEEIDFQIKCDETITIDTDLLLFKSIWHNLIENSIKYRQKGRVNKINIEGKKQHGNVLFSITDTGQGISKKVISNIYQMFFRGNETSTGSGLGLYIVKNALEKIAGTIEYDTSYTAGARFIISIPSKSSKVTSNELS